MRWGTLAAAAVLALVCAPAFAGASSGWLLGAARVDITPPAAGAADPAQFSSCRTALSGPQLGPARR